MRSVPRILQEPHSDVHRSAEVFSLQTSSLCFEGDTGVEALRLVATDVVLPLSTEGSGVQTTSGGKVVRGRWTQLLKGHGRGSFQQGTTQRTRGRG